MNFRQVRKKIKAIGNVKQITKAMQMVASVKMKKSQEAAVAGRTYHEVLARISGRVLSGNEKEKNREAKSSKNLYIFVSSNKGLCGSFNFNLFKKAIAEVDFKNSDFIALGKKGTDFLLRMGGEVVADFSGQLPFIDNVSAVFSFFWPKYLSGEYKSLFLIYNKFISTLRQEPRLDKLLPFEPGESAVESKKSDTDYLIEPSAEEVLEALMEEVLKDKLRGAVLDSEAAEHSSRMMAMKNATDAAGDIIYNLTLLRNKIRQTSITNELLDIVTASQIS